MISRLRRLLAILSVVIFFPNLPNYLSANYGILVPYQWVIGFAIAALPVIIIQLLSTNILKSPVIGWCFLYMLVTILWFIPSTQTEIPWQEVRWRTLTVISLVMFLSLLASPDTNREVTSLMVPAVLLGVGLNIYELFVPLSFSQIIGRPAGFYMNPTTSALALVGGMIVGSTALPRCYRGIFVLLVGVGVVVTFSRGGLIAWCIAASGLLFLKELKPWDLIGGIVFASAAYAVVLFTQWEELVGSLDRTGVINDNVIERVLWVTDPAGVQDHSSWARAYVAQRLWDRWSESPFLGSGTGSAFGAFEIPPHNQFLVFMVDHGIIGCFIFPLLILSVIYRRDVQYSSLAILFGCMQVIAGLTSHTLLGEPQTLLLFALIATAPSSAQGALSSPHVLGGIQGTHKQSNCGLAGEVGV